MQDGLVQTYSAPKVYHQIFATFSRVKFVLAQKRFAVLAIRRRRQLKLFSNLVHQFFNQRARVSLRCPEDMFRPQKKTLNIIWKLKPLISFGKLNALIVAAAKYSINLFPCLFFERIS